MFKCQKGNRKIAKNVKLDTIPSVKFSRGGDRNSNSEVIIPVIKT